MAWNADATAYTLSVDPAINAGEGCTSFSDPITGALLLYSNGNDVYGSDGTVVHTGLQGDASSMHAGAIVPVPGSPGIVYVFGHNSQQSSSLQYARFDVTGSAPTLVGDQGTVALAANAGREGMIVVPHVNGVDYWLLVSGLSSIYVMEVTSSGLSDVVVVDSGLSVWTNGWSLFAVSHQNNRLVMSGNDGGDIAVWDFNPLTGALSNRTVINDPRPANVANREYYGGVFSPDGTKFYFAVLTANDNLGHYYQYDFGTGTYTRLSVGTSRYYFGDGRLGPDGRIYVAGSQSIGLHVIDSPNVAGTDCGFRRDAIREDSPGWAGGCSIQLGLPQSPSPLYRVRLDLAVTINTPTAVVVGGEVTPSGSANAPDGATVAVQIVGPAGVFACSATVAAAAWTCVEPVTGLTPGAYSVDALLAFGENFASDDSAFCATDEGADPAEVCFEVCDDLWDNDLNGYVDVYDPACQPGALTCTAPVEPGAFTIKLAAQTDAVYEDLFWPVIGDVDADGETEVLAARLSPARIDVLDGKTLLVKSTIAIDGDRGDGFVLANLDADPELEVIALIHQRAGALANPLANRMIIADFVDGAWVLNYSATTETVYNCNGNVGSGLGLGVADFNADGKPEIFYGNEIWTYPADLTTACTDCITKIFDADRDVDEAARHGCHPSGSNSQGPISAVSDVLNAAHCGGDAECDGPELIVAGQVYSVDLAAMSMTKRFDINTLSEVGGFGDGFVSVADLDGDGDEDVVVHGAAPGGNLYAYDPASGALLRTWNLPGVGFHGSSPVSIADVWDEDLADDGLSNGSAARLPDLIVTRSFKLYAVNVASLSPLWTLDTSDHSGSTSVSVFDFNGDGTLEMAYRDETAMRVMYGGPMASAPAGVNQTSRNYASFDCPSATMNEGPAIADVNGDGAANIAVVCGSGGGARLRIFESATAPWREARRLWNQSIFVPGAIDDAGRVYPVAQARNSRIPEGTARRPLNIALAQVSPLDLRVNSGRTVAAIDGRVTDLVALADESCLLENTEMRIAFTIENAGDAQLTAATPIALYTNDPEQGTTSLVGTLGDAVLVSGSLPIGPGQSARFEALALTGPAATIWLVINDDGGSQEAGSLLPECDNTNNSATVDCRTCTEEVCDGEDNDCDGVADNNIASEPTTCGVGACADTGSLSCVDAELVDDCAPGQPAASDDDCDRVDDDCNGSADDGYVGLTASCVECQIGTTSACVQGVEVGGECLADDDGIVCDGGLCALAASCQTGQCLPIRVRACDDGNPCTSDFCDADTGCYAEPLADGTACSDGNGCTLADTCMQGICDGDAATCGAPAECEEAGMCNPATGICDYPFITGCVLCDEDRVAPTVTCPDAVSNVECALGGATVTLGQASARDTCSEVVIVNDAPESFGLGVTVVTFTAIDATGNRATCTTNVEVVDTTAPVLVCPDAVSAAGEVDSCGADVDLGITGTDACDGEVVTWVGLGDGFYGPGESDVRVVGFDAAGNQAICDTFVDVTGLDGFVVDCEAEITVEAPADVCGWPDTLVAAVDDVCQAVVDVESDTEGFPIGETLVTFLAERGASSETASCTTKLTVLDVTAPEVTCGGSDEKVDLVATFVPTTSDACSATLTIDNVGCVRETDGVDAVVTERCDVVVERGVLVVVNDAPASEDGMVFVTYTVTGTDPSGNADTIECRAPVDPESLDHDDDTIVDREDNCPITPNTDQADADLDGIGDLCDDTPIDGLLAQGSGCGGGDTSTGALFLAAAMLLLWAQRRRSLQV